MYRIALTRDEEVLGYFVADDEPLADARDAAACYVDRQAAQEDADINNFQWSGFSLGEKFRVV